MYSTYVSDTNMYSTFVCVEGEVDKQGASTDFQFSRNTLQGKAFVTGFVEVNGTQQKGYC